MAQTLEALAAAGFIRLDRIEGRMVPVALVGRLRVEIDPYGLDDRLDFA